MDAALLSGVGGGRRDHRHAVNRRDAIAHGGPYEKAAALVDLVCSAFLYSPFKLNLHVGSSASWQCSGVWGILLFIWDLLVLFMGNFLKSFGLF